MWSVCTVYVFITNWRGWNLFPIYAYISIFFLLWVISCCKIVYLKTGTSICMNCYRTEIIILELFWIDFESNLIISGKSNKFFVILMRHSSTLFPNFLNTKFHSWTIYPTILKKEFVRISIITKWRVWNAMARVIWASPPHWAEWEHFRKIHGNRENIFDFPRT